MAQDNYDRAARLAVYMIRTNGTVRSAARAFGVSKSTVHKDLRERLPRQDPGLYAEVRELLELNKSQRHIRGGMATKAKYEKKQ